MTVPFPTRVPVFPAITIIALLALIEQLEGTDPRYTGLVVCFLLLSVAAFNVVRGLSRPSGAYIAFYSLLVVDVGTFYKASLGQPADSNLSQPLLVMSTYVATMGVMLMAGMFSRRFATSRDGVAGVLQVHEMRFRESSIGCLLSHFLIIAATTYLPGAGGQVLHSIAIVSPFLPLAALLSTIAAVRTSQGTRSVSLISLATLAYIFTSGILSFSKQGMLEPLVCWLLGIAWARFRLRPKHILAIAVYVVLAFEVFTPISADRDDVQVGSTSERLQLIVHYLTHITELHNRYNEWEEGGVDKSYNYYGSSQGLWDRLSMLPNDSSLIAFSDQGHYFGYAAVWFYLANLVPHVLAPHKNEGLSVGGNAYAHEMGGLADADTSTGISFSPTAEAYHIDGWRGVVLLQSGVFLVLFTTVDSVCGDIRRHPWGLFLILAFAHIAPEALLGGAITATLYGTVAISLAVFVCGYITPVLGLLLMGGQTLTSQDPSSLVPIHPIHPWTLPTVNRSQV